MAKRCPKGYICSDTTTIWLVVFVIGAIFAAFWFFRTPVPAVPVQAQAQAPKVYVVQAPAPQPPAVSNQMIRPDLFPEPVQRLAAGIPGLSSRGTAGPITQVGILTAEGGSSGSAAPDRTILPLYGRELDARRGRWNYYTRTDGTNPVQIPVRVKNRICDDDTNGCDEVYNDDGIHVPALGRAFKATIYRKSIFG